jgi:hypothetical protein
VRTERCKGSRCSKNITYAKLPDGNLIPLDVSAPVYRIVGVDVDGVPKVERVKNVLVSHFSTCPNADEFTGRR